MFEYQISKHAHFDAACRVFALTHNLEDVAAAVGMRPQILRNKLNPLQPHRLTCDELLAITDSTEDYDSFDKDHVYMGSITKRAEETYTSRILITISGDLSGSIDDLNVEDVEVIERPTSMDFGELELAYEPDEQDL